MPQAKQQYQVWHKQLKNDGLDYGLQTIHYEAMIKDSFPGGIVPSIATIARLLAGVGHVDRNPRKHPKSSYLLFARSSAMALWQLDAFEFRSGDGKVVTVYQLLDDATRFDVGSWAYQQHENSHDAQDVIASAITNPMGRPKSCSVIILRRSINCVAGGSARWRFSLLPRGLCQLAVYQVGRPLKIRTSGPIKP